VTFILGQAYEPPAGASEEFARGLKFGNELIAKHGDVETVLILIDEIFLAAYLERHRLPETGFR